MSSVVMLSHSEHQFWRVTAKFTVATASSGSCRSTLQLSVRQRREELSLAAPELQSRRQFSVVQHYAGVSFCLQLQWAGSEINSKTVPQAIYRARTESKDLGLKHHFLTLFYNPKLLKYRKKSSLFEKDGSCGKGAPSSQSDIKLM